MAKYKLILSGWEIEASAHSITEEEHSKILAYKEENDIEDLHQMYDELENLVDGYYRYDGNIFTVTRPFHYDDNTYFLVMDENDQEVLSFTLGEINHDSDKFEDLEIESYNADPQFSEHKIIIFACDESKGQLFGCEFESDELPKIEDFEYTTTYINTPDGEMDLIEDIYFKDQKMEKDFNYCDTRGKSSETSIFTE